MVCMVAAELHEPPLNAACLLTGRIPVQVQSPGPVGVNLVGFSMAMTKAL